MPPEAVETIQDLIFWQYAEIISRSAGYDKGNYLETQSNQTSSVFLNEHSFHKEISVVPRA